jgi:two-component system, LytTR family, response regulator
MAVLTNFLSGSSLSSASQRAEKSAGHNKIVLKTRQGFVFLETEDIHWIEAEAQYCIIHCLPEPIRIRKGITEFEQQMDPRLFVRINRSVILNLNHVRILRPWGKGDYEVVMNDGATLRWSRSFKHRLDELLGRIRMNGSTGSNS